jgi:hypothetical protein
MPVPTPANTTPVSHGRPGSASRSSDHADTWIRTNALAIPAIARSTIQQRKLSGNPMASVAKPIAANPARIAEAARIGSAIAESAPSR